MKRDIVLVVERECELLAFMRERLSGGIPNGRIKSFLEHRQTSVDNVVTTRYDFPLRPGQVVRVSGSGMLRVPGLPVIYEDEWLIAVNKPAGLLTVATDTERERTAYAMLNSARRGGVFVVHRLDRDTSGVLLFSKSAEVRDALQERWSELVSRREYFAVCEGIFERKRGRCESHLCESRAHVVYSSSGEGARRAVTNYEVISEGGGYSAVRILIDTGRKNQIRVHMKELGHPIAGDRKYGAAGNPLGRLGLHARTIELIHPVTGAKLSVTAPPEQRLALPKSRKIRNTKRI